MNNQHLTSVVLIECTDAIFDNVSAVFEPVVSRNKQTNFTLSEVSV